MAMSYGHVYVARVAFGAKDAQTVKAFQEAESYPGPVADHRLQPLHRPRLRHGLRLRAAEAGGRLGRLAALPLRPAARRAGGAAARRSTPGRRRSRSREYMRNETRFRMVEKQDPERFRRLLAKAEHEAAPARRGLPAARRPDARARPGASRHPGARRPGAVGGNHGPLNDLPRPGAPASAHAGRVAARRTTSTPCGASRTRAPRPSSCTRCSRSRSAASSCATFIHTEPHGESFAEALSYFPRPEAFALGPDDYLEQLRRIKEAVHVPVIASLNGTHARRLAASTRTPSSRPAPTPSSSTSTPLPTRPRTAAADVEDRTVELVRELQVVDLDPAGGEALALLHRRCRTSRRGWSEAGADGLVLFNRFYQPDIDPEELEVKRDAAPVRLRRSCRCGCAGSRILSGSVRGSLAVTGGVHTGRDAVKAVMAGADAVQMVSALAAPRSRRTCAACSTR